MPKTFLWGVLNGSLLKLSIGMSAALLILAAALAGPERLAPPSGPIPRTLFGMHIHHMLRGAAQPTPWPPIPFGTWRLWDAYVAWPWIEPEKGKWDFANLDKYLSQAEQNRVDVLLPLGLSPTWASSRPEEKSSFGPGYAANPTNLADWHDYVRTVGTRYKGRVHAYEIWNEPNLKIFYTGSTAQLVQLASVAYQALKEIDPAIIVCSPAFTGPSGIPMFEQYLKAGGAKYADVIGYHFYVNPAPPEEMVAFIRQVKEVMVRNGVGNKSLWNTESGWAIQNTQSVVEPATGNGFNSIVLQPDPAAAYVARAYILSWASGVSRFYWYSWDHGDMGLVDHDGKTLKSPAIAYGEIQKWLIGARMDSCTADAAETWTCAISRDGGYRGWLIWTTKTRETLSFAVPSSWNVKRLINLWGHEYALAPGASVEVTVMPNLLEAPGH
jgi:hypothetical protein